MPNKYPVYERLYPSGNRRQYPAVGSGVGGGGGGGGGGISSFFFPLTYSGVQASSVNATSFSFPTFDIKSENFSRMVIAEVSFSNGTALSINSIGFFVGSSLITPTLGRTDATNTNLAKTHIYYASVVSGSSLDVEVWANGQIASGIACHVYHAGPVSQTPVFSAGSNATASAPVIISSMGVSSGGFVVAIAGATTAATAFDAWLYNGIDTLTERTDGLIGGGVIHLYSAIDILINETASNSLSCNITGGNRSCMSVMGWA